VSAATCAVGRASVLVPRPRWRATLACHAHRDGASAPRRPSDVAALLRPLIGPTAGHASVYRCDRDAERRVAETHRRWRGRPRHGGRRRGAGRERRLDTSARLRAWSDQGRPTGTSGSQLGRSSNGRFRPQSPRAVRLAGRFRDPPRVRNMAAKARVSRPRRSAPRPRPAVLAVCGFWRCYDNHPYTPQSRSSCARRRPAALPRSARPRRQQRTLPAGRKQCCSTNVSPPRSQAPALPAGLALATGIDDLLLNPRAGSVALFVHPLLQSLEARRPEPA
jgi:hypothetical protein